MRLSFLTFGGAIGLGAIAFSGLTTLKADDDFAYKAIVPGVARDVDPPTATVVPATPTATPPPAPLGTRANPVPLGASSSFTGSWSVRVTSVTPNATSAILAENQFNDPPKPGHQFFLARVTATYTGAGSAQFDGGFRLRAVGHSAVERTQFGNSCGVIPDDLPDPTVFAGGVVSGNVCWEIPASDANTMLVYDDPFLAVGNGVFLSMIPPGQPIPAVRPPAALASMPASGYSRESALPLGTEIPAAGGWNVRVLSIVPNATALVLAENQFNDPPKAGHQFFMARIAVTSATTDPGSFDGSFRLRTVGASAVVWTTFSNSCGVIPDELTDNDVFPGGVIEGNVCWEIPLADANNLVLLDDPFLMDSFGIYLSLH